MLPSWCGDTITVLRAPLVSQRGAKVRDWANAETHDITGCSLQLASSATQDAYGRLESVATFGTILCPPGADVKAGDRVRFDGQTFEINGEPFAKRSPFGNCDHVRLTVTARRG